MTLIQIALLFLGIVIGFIGMYIGMLMVVIGIIYGSSKIGDKKTKKEEE